MQRMAHYLDRPIPGKRVNYMAKRFSMASIQRSSAGRCPKGYDNPNGGTVVGSMNLWTARVIFGLRVPRVLSKPSERDALATLLRLH